MFGWRSRAAIAISRRKRSRPRDADSSARMLTDLVRGRLNPGIAASNKFFTSNLLQSLSECAMELLGASGLLYEQPDAVHNLADAPTGYKYLYNRCLTIAGGTSEVQRNIIAQRVLGLPR